MRQKKSEEYLLFPKFGVTQKTLYNKNISLAIVWYGRGLILTLRKHSITIVSRREGCGNLLLMF